VNPERAIQTVEEGHVVAADSGTIMAVIARAASDPNTDVDKLERLMAMAERLSARQAETAFNEAMNEAQTSMRAIAKDAQSDKGKYASFVALDKAARPIYAAQGFSLSFDTGDGAPADHIRLLCYVSHREGHTRTYHVDMPADGKGAKGGDVMTKTHATGAAMTYGQRYLFRLIFNLAVGEDNDGTIREASNEELDFIVEINDAATAAELAAWKAKTGEAAAKYPRVIRAYNERAGRLKQAKAEASDFPGDRR
jgi:hypothetical protein